MMHPLKARLRVLVFDDEMSMRDMLHCLLTDMGCEVFSFHDPAVFPFYKENRCVCASGHACADILISDMNMPCVSGLRFMESSSCKIPFKAIMSGTWEDADMKRAHDLNLNIFTKPFKMNEVRNWIETCSESIPADRVLDDSLQKLSPPDGKAFMSNRP